MKTAFTILFSLLLCACTNQQIYNQAKHDQKRDCVRNATTPNEIEQCGLEEQKWLSFEDYEKQREEVLNSK